MTEINLLRMKCNLILIIQTGLYGSVTDCVSTVQLNLLTCLLLLVKFTVCPKTLEISQIMHNYICELKICEANWLNALPQN